MPDAILIGTYAAMKIPLPKLQFIILDHVLNLIELLLLLISKMNY